MLEAKDAVLKKGDLLTLSIDAVAFGGQGVGRYGDLVVFVPYTVQGDAGLIEIAEVKKRYALGRLLTLETPSPFRVESLCSVYGHCGGCQYQHIAYERQLAIKQRQIHDVFSRIGKFPAPPLAGIAASPDPWHYRGKAEFHVARSRGQAPVVGFTRTASHEVVDIERCEIVDPSINEALAALRRNVRAEAAKRIDRREILWSGEGNDAPHKDLVARMVKGQELLIPRRGFFQANHLLAETLLDTVLQMSALTGNETVIDGYCGAGFFSVFLAPRAKRFSGIEWAGEAVHAAEMNLKNAGIDQALFYKGDVGEILMDVFVKAGQRADVLVLDPPRDGLGPAVLKATAKIRPSRIVYVSCNPATMARDVRFLVDQGYRLETLQPLDMFPQTSHIEVAGLLTMDLQDRRCGDEPGFPIQPGMAQRV